jgi:TRAP-type C4-dicarboxylate transport system permease small subunit
LRALAVIEDGLLVALLVLLIVMSGGQILFRNLFGVGLMDLDSFSRVLVLWLGMLGAVAAARHKKQINVDVLSPRLPKRMRAVVGVVMDLFTVAISLVVAYYSWSFLQIEFESGATLFASVPAWTTIIILPLAFGLMAFHYTLHAIAGIFQLRQIDKPL